MNWSSTLIFNSLSFIPTLYGKRGNKSRSEGHKKTPISEGHVSNKIQGKRKVMKHLVGCVAYLLPSCLQRVNNKMSNKDSPKLPAPSENDVKRHTVKQTMGKKMIPVLALRLGKEIGLQNVVT